MIFWLFERALLLYYEVVLRLLALPVILFLIALKVATWLDKWVSWFTSTDEST